MSSSSDSSNSDESFLSRWSRRKRGEERDPLDSALEQKNPGESASSTKVEESAAVEKVDLTKLPKIEDLLPSSDISAFLQKGVPEELKRLALRKAWALDPQIRDFIEVAENQYDWNKPDGVPGFGPLDPGTDIEALLKQATGQLEIAEKKVETSSSEVAVTARSNNELPSEETPTEVHRDGAAAKSQSEEPSSVSASKANEFVGTDDDPEQSKEAGTSTRRRHGGALPA